MNLKILLKKITRSSISIFIRNNLNLSPVDIDIDFLNKKTSISDAFCWRTDNGYKTVVKFSNLVKMFFNQDAQIKIIFFSKQNMKIKEIILNSNNLSHEILINKEYMNGIEDYGTFFIFHNLDTVKNKTIISNRCYVGYSLNNQLPSFVHGNTLVKYENNTEYKKDIIKNTFINKRQYIVQNLYSIDSQLEIYIANPTSKIINVFFDNKIFKMKPFNCKIIKTNLNKISLKSDCMFLRPIIFESKKEFLNVHHG